MKYAQYFKSLVDQDVEPIVICDTAHTIIYMNPVAERRYAKRGGAALVGRSLLACHNAASNAAIERVLDWFGRSAENNRVFTYRNEAEDADVYMIALRDESGTLIGYYEKREIRRHDSGAYYAMDED